MPLLAFAKERFDPDLALVHGFLVGEGLLVALSPFHVVGKKGTVDVPTTVAFGTLRFHRAGIADRRIRTVFDFVLLFAVKRNSSALGATILIMARHHR